MDKDLFALSPSSPPTIICVNPLPETLIVYNPASEYV